MRKVDGVTGEGVKVCEVEMDRFMLYKQPLFARTFDMNGLVNMGNSVCRIEMGGDEVNRWVCASLSDYN